MSDAEFDLLPEHLEACDWRSVLESCSVRDCWDYSHAFITRVNEAGSDLSLSDAAALRYLARVCSAVLTPEKKDPFRPRFTLENGTTSPIPSDLTDSEVGLLRWIVANVEDPELRARAADYLWLLRGDHRMADAAIEAYFDAAKALEENRGQSAVARLCRAVRLAAQLGKSGEPFRKALARLESVVARHGTLSDGFVVSLLDLALEVDAGEPLPFGGYATDRAERAEVSAKPMLAVRYWQMAATWRARAGDPAGEKDALTRRAEVYVREAEAALAQEPPNYLAAASHFEAAIEAYRRFAGNNARVAALMDRMDDAQSKGGSQLHRIESSVEITDMVRQARELVRGKTLLDALLHLGLVFRPTPKAEVRDDVIEATKQFPLQHLFPKLMTDGAQRVIGRRGSLTDEAPEEQALSAEMFSHAAIYQDLSASGHIEPARREIWSEHPCTERDLAPLVVDNPFVPPGHELLFMRGLHAGLAGDFVQSTHVLGLQLENSVRHVLNRSGVRTTSLRDGVQEERPLPRLLAMPECSAILGEDVVFDLRALLTERFGSNLRHRLAHGLMSDGHFGTRQDRYLWWITLHLCCRPVYARLKAAAADVDEASQREDPAAPPENGGKNGSDGGREEEETGK